MLEIKLFTPEGLNISGDVKEDQPTFCANAAKKAKWYFKKADMPVVADDGGLEIAVLNSEPGVYSRRWPGYEASDDELIDYTLEKLADFPSREDRQAQLTTCVVFYNGEHLLRETGAIKGYITQEPSKQKTAGYPFRDIFVVSGLEKYYNELTKKEHQQVNHRQEAVENLTCRLLKNKIWGKNRST